MAEEFEDEFRSAATLVTDALQTIESRPVIPREIEDILSISTAERRRWLQDGRLPSAGTRTVKLRGRAKRITFHLFDPALVEDLLDRGIVDEWREDDAAAQLENRRRAAYQAILTRSLKKAVKTRSETETRAQSVTSDLTGWEEFSRRHDCTRPQSSIIIQDHIAKRPPSRHDVTDAYARQSPASSGFSRHFAMHRLC